jgi:Tol biopolymer transport system component
MNRVVQFFHSVGDEPREVLDLDSNLAVYVLSDHAVVAPECLRVDDRLETYPAWSADGTYLYFCSAPLLWADRKTVPPKRYEEVRYDLMRIGYDVESKSWGEVENVLSARETGMSIALPRTSPDGRFLLFCMCDYGCFPVHHESADLYLMDLQTGEYRRLAINSDQSDSWHSWSSNGRWFVFSSRRGNGMFARPYLAHVDADGEVHRPLLLPQKDPRFYGSLLETYNLPELVRGPINVRPEAIDRVLCGDELVEMGLPTTGATPWTGTAMKR